MNGDATASDESVEWIKPNFALLGNNSIDPSTIPSEMLSGINNDDEDDGVGGARSGAIAPRIYMTNVH